MVYAQLTLQEPLAVLHRRGRSLEEKPVHLWLFLGGECGLDSCGQMISFDWSTHRMVDDGAVSGDIAGDNRCLQMEAFKDGAAHAFAQLRVRGQTHTAW